MQFLNTMPEEELRKEYKILSQTDEIKIEVLASKDNGFYMPDPEGDIQLWAKFKRMGVEDFWLIEKFAKRVEKIDGKPITDYDSEEMKKQTIRFQLKDWNLDIELSFDDANRLDKDCWQKIMKLPAPLMNAFVQQYQETYIITPEDERDIDRQSLILFGKNSRGVDNACEAITLFCVLSSMWEKFGINRFQIKDLSYKEYVMLRMVMAKEIEAQKRQMNSAKNKNATRVMGPGGKTRPSRGITVEG